jgi:hypothetical protein
VTGDANYKLGKYAGVLRGVASGRFHLVFTPKNIVRHRKTQGPLT